MALDKKAMRRRAFIRTVTGLLSAAAFTSTGWLMGARALSMGAQMPPPPSSQGCQVFCASARQCAWDSVGRCDPNVYASPCDTEDYYWYSYTSPCATPYDCFELRVAGVCDCFPCPVP